MLARKEEATTREVIIMATWNSPYGMACPGCDASLIAPNRSRYVSKYQVSHFWSCEGCGRQIEMVVDFRTNAASKASESGRPEAALLA